MLYTLCSKSVAILIIKQQDYYYLVETVPFKEYLLRSDPSASERESITKINETTSSLAEDIEYADDFRRNLTSQLSIPDFIINNGTFQTTGLGYVKWLQTNTDLGWFAYQVSRIACLYVSHSESQENI